MFSPGCNEPPPASDHPYRAESFLFTSFPSFDHLLLKDTVSGMGLESVGMGAAQYIVFLVIYLSSEVSYDCAHFTLSGYRFAWDRLKGGWVPGYKFCGVNRSRYVNV